MGPRGHHDIMTEKSVRHLQKALGKYKGDSPYDTLESTKKEGKGEDLENAFLNLAQCLQNKPLYFADRLYDSMKGKGTCDKVPIRILVSCSEVDMLKIRSEFKTSTSPCTTTSSTTGGAGTPEAHCGMSTHEGAPLFPANSPRK